MNPASPSPHLVLPRADTFHYHNLPDLTGFLRRGLTTHQWDATLLQGFMAPFCLQVRRQAHHRAPVSMPTAHRAALINVLHGLLLGLYPYNLKHMTFEHRVKVAGAIRGVLTAAPSAQRAFIAAHEPLLLFAMVEYLANAVPDFCPVEEALLVRTAGCRYSLNQACEAWRAAAVDLIPTGRGGADDGPMWAALTELADAHLPGLLRQLKAHNYKAAARPPAAPRPPPGAAAHLDDPAFFARLMAMPCVAPSQCNTIAQIRLVAPDLPFPQLQTVEWAWGSLFVRRLPANVVDAQMQALGRIGSCELLQRARTLVHVCLRCALRHKAPVLGQRFAYNCVSTTLQCATCSRQAVAINLLGRVLRVRDTAYFLCTQCLRPVPWDGVNTFAACARCAPPPPPRRAPHLCFACDHKAVDVVRGVLDADRLEAVALPLCSRHAKPCILSRSTVYDTLMLQRDVWRRP